MLKKTAAGVVAMLIILIFLSGTIHNFNMPTVTAAMPRRGTLNQIELTTGIVRHGKIIDLHADISGTVQALLVREGDAVSEGQPIIQMDFGGAEDEIAERIETAAANLQDQLNTLQLNRSGFEVDIARTNANIQNTQRQIDELRREEDRPDTVSDFEVRQARADLEQAQEDVNRIRQLADSGIATRVELTAAEANLASSQSRYERQQQLYNEQVERSLDNISDRAENRASQIKSLEHQLELFQQDLQARSLDIQTIHLQEEAARRDFQLRKSDYQRRIEDYTGSAVLTAPADGIIVLLPVNTGQHIHTNQLIASVGLADNFIVETEIPLSNNFITAGDTGILFNASHTIEGTVTMVTPQEGAKKLTIVIEPGAAEVQSGETFNIRFEETSRESFVLVPNGAVNRDSDGYFLNQIRRRRGMLGTEFYTERLRVYIGDSDSENTAIVRGINFFEPIALVSDRPFSPGQSIRLRNEADFFEN